MDTTTHTKENDMNIKTVIEPTPSTNDIIRVLEAAIKATKRSMRDYEIDGNMAAFWDEENRLYELEITLASL